MCLLVSELPINLMQCPANPSLRELNKINEIFHGKQARLLRKRITVPRLYKMAMRSVTSEVMREVGIRAREPLEAALERVVEFRRQLSRELKRAERRTFSAKGGKATKADALSVLIEGFVREQPDLTVVELLAKLKSEIGRGVILFIQDENEVLIGERPKDHICNERRARKEGFCSRTKGSPVQNKEKYKPIALSGFRD